MKIIITGAGGLVGSAINKISKEFNDEFYFLTRKEVNLLDREKVFKVFKEIKPDAVVHTAARVGGIGKNLNNPVQQYSENILINTNVIDGSFNAGVDKLIAFSSVCAFPSTLSYLQEDRLHDGSPYDAHESYAYSKRMVDIHIKAYKKQYGVNYCSVIPGNIFGENDNFHIEEGHVIPSLVHKFYVSKKNNTPVKIWGDGLSYREFIYSEDLARICLLLLQKNVLPQKLLVSGEKEYQIKEIVDILSKCFNYSNIEWDTTKPNGQRKRPSDHTLFKTYFSNYNFESLEQSLKKTVSWFNNTYPNIRIS